MNVETTIQESIQTSELNENERVQDSNTESPQPSANLNKEDMNNVKEKLEFLSIIIAISSIVLTFLTKVISSGKFLYFAFDFNYCDLSLNLTDFVIFVSFLFVFGISFTYYYLTNNFKNNLINKSQKLTIRVLLQILFFAGFLLLGVIGKFFFLMFRFFENLSELYNIFITFSFVILIYISILTMNATKWKKVFLGIIVATILLLTTVLINFQYEKALNQTEFQIISQTNGLGVDEKYVIISDGDEYSAYLCIVDKQGFENQLVIITNIHKYFSHDDVSTQTIKFSTVDEYGNEKPNVIYKTINTMYTGTEEQYNDFKQLLYLPS